MNIDHEADKLLELFDSMSTPDKMTPGEYVEFAEAVIGSIQVRLEAFEEDAEGAKK